jgi:O-antigen ligase
MRAIRAKSFEIGTAGADKHSEPISASSYFELLAFYGILITIVLFAIPYGTVEVWHKSLLVLMISVLGGLRVIDGILKGSFRIAESLLLLPLVGILGLAVVQIVPWPGAASAISLDPYETKTFIFILGGLIVAVEVLFFYTTTAHRLKCLVVLVIAVGVGSAVFGILRELVLDTQSDLLSSYLRPDQGFAQFINRNHFAVLMEMSLGLLLGILIKGELSEKFRFVGWVLSGLMIYSIIASTSRGGLISLAALNVFAVFVHIITRHNPPTANDERSGRISYIGKITVRKTLAAVGFCGLVLGVIMVTIAFVGGDAVVTRIEKLSGEVETVDNTRVNRNLIWNSTLDLIKDKPIFGSGFGGFAAAIPKFDASSGKFSLNQAHNDYLEILANGGIVGFTLFAGFGGLVVGRISKNLKARDPFIRSCCFGAAIGMFGVLIHSFVDFGLHIMINAMIFSVLVVIATARLERATGR